MRLFFTQHKMRGHTAKHNITRTFTVGVGLTVPLVLSGCSSTHENRGTHHTNHTKQTAATHHVTATTTTPLWEQPELLAKYPVRAKKNPDGSYDYSDPHFENADLCKDLPPHYWEKRGYRITRSSFLKHVKAKDCFIDDGNEDPSQAVTIGTDKRERKDVVGRLFKQYRPGRFDQIADGFGLTICVAYVETQIGRVGFAYADDEDTMSEAQLCEKARENLAKVSK